MKNSSDGSSHVYTQAEHFKEVTSLVDRLTRSLQAQLAKHYVMVINQRIMNEKREFNSSMPDGLLPPVGGKRLLAEPLPGLPTQLTESVSLPPLPTSHSPTSPLPSSRAPPIPPSPQTNDHTFSPRGLPLLQRESSPRSNPLREAALKQLAAEQAAKQSREQVTKETKEKEIDAQWEEYLKQEEGVFKSLLKENPSIQNLPAEAISDLLERRMRSVGHVGRASTKGLLGTNNHMLATATPRYTNRQKGWSVMDTAHELRLYKQKLRHDRIREMQLVLSLQKKKEVPPWRQPPVSPNSTAPEGVAIVEEGRDAGSDSGHPTFWSPREDLRQAVFKEQEGKRRAEGDTPALKPKLRFASWDENMMMKPGGTQSSEFDKSSASVAGPGSSFTRTYASRGMGSDIFDDDAFGSIEPESLTHPPNLTPHPPPLAMFVLPSPKGNGGVGQSAFSSLDTADVRQLHEVSPNILVERPPPTNDPVVNQLLSKMQGPYQLGSKETTDMVERDLESIRHAHAASAREAKQKLRNMTNEVRNIFSSLGNVLEQPADRANATSPNALVSSISSTTHNDDFASQSLSGRCNSFSGGLQSLVSNPSGVFAGTSTTRVTPMISKERQQTRKRLLDTCELLDGHIDRVSDENKVLLDFVQQGFDGLRAQVQNMTHLSNDELQTYMKKFEDIQRKQSLNAANPNNPRRSTVGGRQQRTSLDAPPNSDAIPDIVGLKSGVNFLSSLSKEVKYMTDATKFFDTRKTEFDNKREAQFRDPAGEVIANAIEKMQSHGTDLTKMLRVEVPVNRPSIQQLKSSTHSRPSIHSTSALISFPEMDTPRNKAGGEKGLAASVGFSIRAGSNSADVTSGEEGSPLDAAHPARLGSPQITSRSSTPASVRTTGGAVSVFSSSRWAPRTIHREGSFMSTVSASPSMAPSAAVSRRTNLSSTPRRVAPGHKKKKKAKAEDPKQVYTVGRKQIDIANINQLIDIIQQEKEKLEAELAKELVEIDEQEKKRRAAARSSDIALQIALVLETHEKKSNLLTDADLKRVEGLIQDSDVMVARLNAVKAQISASIDEKESLKKELSANVTSDINELDELLTRTDAETRYARIQRKHLVAKYWEWRKLREVGDESAAPTFFEELKRGPRFQETAVQNAIQTETMPAQLRRFARLVKKEESISRLIRGVEVTVGDLELSNREVHELLCCPLCQNTFTDAVSLWPCGHSFCRGCFESEQMQVSRGVHRCPKCSTIGSEGCIANPLVGEILAKWEVMERGYTRMRHALKVVKLCIGKIQQRTLQRRMTAVSGTVVVDELLAAGVQIDDGWKKYTGAYIPASALEEMERRAVATSQQEDGNIHLFDIEASHEHNHRSFMESMSSFRSSAELGGTEFVENMSAVSEYKSLVLSQSNIVSPHLSKQKSPGSNPFDVSDGDFSQSSHSAIEDD